MSQRKYKLHLPLPDCLFIGPQKTGTTWIHQYLISRGDICLPKQIKETFFFDSNYKRGLEWYSNHFKNYSDKLRIVEIAPTYFHSPDATVRIKNDIGTIHIVCTLRNPIDRTFSLYLHMLRYGMTRYSFKEALNNHSMLIDSSRYAAHLQRWFDSFNYETVLILFQENLVKSPETWISKICKHIQIPYMTFNQNLNQRINESTLPYNSYLAYIGQRFADAFRSAGIYSPIEFAKQIGLKQVFFGKPGRQPLPTLSQQERLILIDKFLPEIERLESLIKIDLSEWKRLPNPH